jgi:tetratricopeptide (TPR) repeat protein
MPLPYPHRATFLASTLVASLQQSAATGYFARLLSVIVFDHFLRHPMVTLGDDDDRLIDDDGRLLDAHHPHIEDSIDWLFRIARRHEVLWLEGSVDRARPQVPVLRARSSSGKADEWTSSAERPLSHQLGDCLRQWLAARRLPPIGALPEFTIDDLRAAGDRLAKAGSMLSLRPPADLTQIPPALLSPLPKLAVPYLRVLAEISGGAARQIDPKILEIDNTHPVARRNLYVTRLIIGQADRREILPLVREAPMFGKPHLSIWGEPFAADRPYENMGVRHQGIAASLMPANPYACHNYSLQLAEAGRREESYRWADRATVAAPEFGAAHLDCVRRLRQIGRPAQAFAEAQYRAREICDRAASGKLSANDAQAPHHAALLIAFAHLDVGRIAEAIEVAEDALQKLSDDPALKEAFAWAAKRVLHWKTDAGLLARAYAWEGYYRGDPGRAVNGLARGRIADEDDALIMIDSLLTLGREDQALVATYHCAGIDGPGLLGDGKARLAAARAFLLAGELEAALDQIQIVQLRRGESRLEAEINRVLRLAATRSGSEWERVVQRRVDRGSRKLAQLAARDLADFVPGLDTPVIRRALGDPKPLAVDPRWLKELIAALPLAPNASAAILGRLARPDDDTLAAADTLAQEWWSALVAPTKDREAHAAGAVLALAVALVQYFAEATAAATPIAGAYRHIATEALHLVRRARYQIEPASIRALLAVIDRLRAAPDWLLDTWLLRVERALDLEAEHGAYLDAILEGLPTVQRMLRGDERTGWELRMAHDLAQDPSQYEPAAMLFERCVRAVEAGGTALAWSIAASAAAPPSHHLDVHWVAAMANPTGVCAPWLAVARGLFALGRPNDAFDAACHAVAAATPKERTQAIAELTPPWRSAGIRIPIDGQQAFEAGMRAASEDRLDAAIEHLRWAVACEPGNAQRAHSLAAALARASEGPEAVRVLAAHERSDAPRLVGRALVESGRLLEAVPLLRYASRRFRSAEDWGLLAITAARADQDGVTVEAGRRAVKMGASDPGLLCALATSLYRLGEFVECEQIAKQLIGARVTKEARLVGLHAMARALAGQGRHVDAHPYAKEAARLGPNGELAADLIQTMDRIVAQQTPPIRPSQELSIDRQAFAELEAGRFDSLVAATASPSWAITRAALAACEFRREDESGMPVSPRALEAALAVLQRTVGTTNADAAAARIRALRIRDAAFIQIDPPPPLGVRMTWEDFERQFLERSSRPHRPSALMSYAR